MDKKFMIAAISILALMFILILGSNLKKDKNETQVSSQNALAVASENDAGNIEETTSSTEDSNIESKDNEENKEVAKQEEYNKNVDKNSEEMEEEKKAPTGNTTYYIKVNYKENVVTIYEKDDDGYYTKPIKAMICSCGTATPESGTYKTSAGYEWGYLEGGTFGRYSTRIKGGIMFHSVPYVEESEDTLEYWEYDKLGTTASLGCVRLCVKDCKWIFDNCEVGTQVEFYGDSNPGPLGKPSAKKISDNEECRNWDPTDPSPNSPWNE